jgi:hypothetical protein
MGEGRGAASGILFQSSIHTGFGHLREVREGHLRLLLDPVLHDALMPSML